MCSKHPYSLSFPGNSDMQAELRTADPCKTKPEDLLDFKKTNQALMIKDDYISFPLHLA